ncbi:hypothetical protein [Yoonia sp. SS1-5]|uniref:Uncharacterized protein n=1 Tax=Yoonia rhodophyticola TaxID=3137370 RepID=A0AAN0NKC6_9RHOB
MRVLVRIGFVGLMLVPGAVSAQDLQDPTIVARLNAACEPLGVAGAVVSEPGVIRVTCGEDATAFVPLLGGLAPLVGAGVVTAIASGLTGGNTTPDTQ